MAATHWNLGPAGAAGAGRGALSRISIIGLGLIVIELILGVVTTQRMGTT